MATLEKILGASDFLNSLRPFDLAPLRLVLDLTKNRKGATSKLALRR